MARASVATRRASPASAIVDWTSADTQSASARGRSTTVTRSRNALRMPITCEKWPSESQKMYRLRQIATPRSISASSSRQNSSAAQTFDCSARTRASHSTSRSSSAATFDASSEIHSAWRTRTSLGPVLAQTFLPELVEDLQDPKPLAAALFPDFTSRLLDEAGQKDRNRAAGTYRRRIPARAASSSNPPANTESRDHRSRSGSVSSW